MNTPTCSIHKTPKKPVLMVSNEDEGCVWTCPSCQWVWDERRTKRQSLVRKDLN